MKARWEKGPLQQDLGPRQENHMLFRTDTMKKTIPHKIQGFSGVPYFISRLLCPWPFPVLSRIQTEIIQKSFLKAPLHSLNSKI